MKMIYNEELKDYICYGDGALISVVEVEASKEHTLLIKFSNGEKKRYDVKPLLEKEIFKTLKNITFFLTARVEYGTVVWSDEVDIAPEHLYEYSVAV